MSSNTSSLIFKALYKLLNEPHDSVVEKKIRDDTWSKLNWTKFLVRLTAEAGDPLLQQTVTIHIYVEKILQKFREEPTVTT